MACGVTVQTGVMTTRLTRWGHACIRLERDGTVLVLDPGVFSQLDGALEGATAILVTHEHPDHVDAPRVGAAASAGTPVWAPPSVVQALRDAGAPAEALHVAEAGQSFRVGAFDVRTVGEWHAEIHPDVPLVPNVGYLVDGVFHPGDSFVVPDEPVTVLLTPAGGPWVAMRDTVSHVRAIGPSRVVLIHDVHLSDAGRGLVTTLIGRLGGAGEPVVLAPGEGIDVPLP